MPDYNAIYEAAYINNVPELTRLLAAPGVNINTLYQVDYEMLSSAVGSFGLFAKRAAGIAGVGTATLASLGCALELAGAAAPAAGPTPLAAGLVGISIVGGAGVAALATPERDLIRKSYNKNKWSAMHFAALGNSIAAAKILIDSKINLSLKDEYGRSCWKIAYQMGYEDFMEKCVEHLQMRMQQNQASLATATRNLRDATRRVATVETRLAILRARHDETLAALREARAAVENAAGQIDDLTQRLEGMQQNLNQAQQEVNRERGLYQQAQRRELNIRTEFHAYQQALMQAMNAANEADAAAAPAPAAAGGCRP